MLRTLRDVEDVTNGPVHTDTRLAFWGSFLVSLVGRSVIPCWVRGLMSCLRLGTRTQDELPGVSEDRYKMMTAVVCHVEVCTRTMPGLRAFEVQVAVRYGVIFRGNSYP